ncbi:MAG: type II toxin-antitoxin system RelB/DinJ family antitoxin [bacterium]
MTTQVIFRIDKKIKIQAQKKAKGSGLTFSDILQMATYAYVKNDFEPVLMRKKERLNMKTRRELMKISSDIKKGKNLVGPFTSAEKMDKFLDSLT